MEKLLRNSIFSENSRPLKKFLEQLCIKLPYDSSVYLVGGLVRDILLGITGGKDIDLMVDLCGFEKNKRYFSSIEKIEKI